MAITKVPDHGAVAVANLKGQFRSKPKMGAFVAALVRPFDDLETSLQQMSVARFDEDAAVGVQLDMLAGMLGMVRGSTELDPALRARIRAEIKIFASRGTGDDIINATIDVVAGWNVALVAPAVSQADFEAYARRLSDAAIMPYEGGTAQAWTEDEFNAVWRVINRAKADGVYFVLLSRDDGAKSGASSRFGFDGVGTFDVDYNFQIRTRGAEDLE